MPYGSVGPANAARPQQQRQTQTAGRQAPQQGNPVEDFLFGPTQRPVEPVTAGVGFGPGARTLPQPAAETEEDFLLRVLPQAGPELQSFLNRVAAGG